jgi:hypothetical protein
MSVEITRTETWRDGKNVITIDFSDTVNGFGFRMSLNGKSDHGWTWHRPPNGGGTERVEMADDGTFYAYFGPYWEWHFPIDTVVHLVPCKKA